MFRGCAESFEKREPIAAENRQQEALVAERAREVDQQRM
jgi:hypothetical protein